MKAIYGGLDKTFTIVQDAYNDVKQNKYPDFTGEVPNPPALPPQPSIYADLPFWCMLLWRTVEYALLLLANKNAKLAEILPPMEESGDELVKELQPYFPPSSFTPHLHTFPSLPPSKLSVLPGT